MRRALILTTLALLLMMPSGLAAPSFNQAVAEYNAGKFPQALSNFNTIKASYPNNPLLRYYIAMCHQQMGHISDAKAEYTFVTLHGDSNLVRLASIAINQLSGLGPKNSAVSVSASNRPPQQGPGAGGPSAPQASKVKKILEFYADW